MLDHDMPFKVAKPKKLISLIVDTLNTQHIYRSAIIWQTSSRSNSTLNLKRCIFSIGRARAHTRENFEVTWFKQFWRETNVKSSAYLRISYIWLEMMALAILAQDFLNSKCLSMTNLFHSGVASNKSLPKARDRDRRLLFLDRLSALVA